MKAQANNLHPVRQTLLEYLPKPFIDNVSGTLQYYGYAPLGVAEDEAGWRIEKHEVVGTVTKVTYPRGSMDFKFKWSDRASLTYTR
jgi:hypothetical protein